MTEYKSLEEQVGISGYYLQFSGVGGIIKQIPEDFIVCEIIPNGQPLTTGREIGEDIGGMYIHFVLWKRGLDTHSALLKIKRLCSLNENDFGYAGLKDAQGVTYQRVSIWNGNKECLGQINLPDLKILNPIRKKFGISIGDLLGNYFQVKIRNIQREMDQEELNSFCSDAESNGFLNYYGLQRFGSKRPILHMFGKYVLREKYSLAVDLYLGGSSEFENEKITKIRQMYAREESLVDVFESFPSRYSFERKMLRGLIKGHSKEKIIKSLPIYFLRLAVSAYQSYIFNQMLSTLNNQNYELLSKTNLPIIGYSTDVSKYPLEIKSFLHDYFSMDDFRLDFFKHKIKKVSSKGTERAAIVKPYKIKALSDYTQDKNIEIHFSLSKGSYGTMFLREFLKNRINQFNYSG